MALYLYLVWNSEGARLSLMREANGELGPSHGLRVDSRK
jgi:hypothetical protein